MNWEEIESTGSLIAGVSCGVHPIGLTNTEYELARKICLLQEAYDQIDHVRWWLYVVGEECEMRDNHAVFQGITKKEGTQIKRKLTRRINDLKKKLAQARGWVGEEPATEADWYPDVEPWMKARPDKKVKDR